MEDSFVNFVPYHNTYLNRSPQPTEVGQYKINSCTLKPKTKFSFNQKQYRNLIFFEFEWLFFSKIEIEIFSSK